MKKNYVSSLHNINSTGFSAYGSCIQATVEGFKSFLHFFFRLGVGRRLSVRLDLGELIGRFIRERVGS